MAFSQDSQVHGVRFGFITPKLNMVYTCLCNVTSIFDWVIGIEP